MEKATDTSFLADSAVTLLLFVSFSSLFSNYLVRVGHWLRSIAIALGLALLIAVGVLGAQRFPNGMPLAATCSAAISAACHPPAEDTEPHLFSVRWGVVESDVEGRAHCAFTTARDVRVLEEGELMMWVHQDRLFGTLFVRAERNNAVSPEFCFVQFWWSRPRDFPYQLNWSRQVSCLCDFAIPFWP